MKLSFVILTWNSEKTIGEALSGISASCAAEDIGYETFIVDNGSSDGTVGIIRDRMSSMPIDLTILDKNYGTTGPRNMALRKATGDIVCVLDSDAVIREGSIRDLAHLLDSDPSIGIIAPKLVFPDGATQESIRRFPSVIGKFSKIPGIVLKLRYRDIDAYPDFPFDDIREIDYAISACWFFRRALLDEAGYLDERIFYAPEDVDFCLRVWKAGKKILYYPPFTVMHYIQRITHKQFFGKIARSHLMGLCYYFLKHRYFIKPSRD